MADQPLTVAVFERYCREKLEPAFAHIHERFGRIDRTLAETRRRFEESERRSKRLQTSYRSLSPGDGTREG
jgi:hypothetical protein